MPDAVPSGQVEGPVDAPEFGDGPASDGSGDEAPEPWEAPSSNSTMGHQYSSFHGDETPLPRGADDLSHAMRSDYIPRTTPSREFRRLLRNPATSCS